jgi:hypothetical protein
VAVATGPAVLRFIGLDYNAAAPATTDLLIKSMERGVAFASGDTLLTQTNINTDVSIRPFTMTAGVDEGNAAIAATDGTAGGMPVRDGFIVDVAQSDALTAALIVDVWYEEVEYIRTTLRPVGADGSAADSRLVFLDGRRAGIVRAIAVDYQNQPATADLTIKADVAGDLSGGTTVFTAANTATDIPTSPVGMPAANETAAATAATDATDGGWPFKSNLLISVAQGDGQVGGDELINVDLWIDG